MCTLTVSDNADFKRTLITIDLTSLITFLRIFIQVAMPEQHGYELLQACVLIKEITSSALSSLFLLKDENELNNVKALLQSKYSLVAWLLFQTFGLRERMVCLCICLRVLIFQEALQRQIFLSNSDFFCSRPIVIWLKQIPI